MTKISVVIFSWSQLRMIHTP